MKSVLFLIATTFVLVVSGCSSQLARDEQKVIPRSGGAIVEVGFYDSKIHMPTVIPSGHITFRISNPSHNDHNFKITATTSSTSFRTIFRKARRSTSMSISSQAITE